MLSTSNIIAESFKFPEFSKISVADLETNIRQRIVEYQQISEKIASDDKLEISWDKIMQPLEDASAKLDELVNIVSQLHAVKDNVEMRTAYTNIITILTKFNSDLLQNKSLYQKILQLSATKAFSNFSNAQKKIIKDLLLNFKLAGVELSSDKQLKYKKITEQLSLLSDQFSKNVLDATQSWKYYVSSENKNKLIGLPDYFLHLAEQAAIKQGKKQGWLLTLDLPTVDLILKYAQDRELRKVFYTAHITKASEKCDQEYLKFNNSEIMLNIIKLRQELAVLLDFKNYSEYSLAHKMAKSTDEVINFLNELAIKSKSIAKQEFKKLQEFAKQQDPKISLEPWDVSFYSERYKEKLFNLPEEELRNYFTLNKVLTGMFKLANDLYGIKVQEVTEIDPWDPEVKLYQVIEKDGSLAGYFYLDLYVRENKQSGAWMGSYLSRHKWANGNLQHPIAFLVTNFIKPVNGEPLLYHIDVITLLHEFGHVLHHILTKVDYISAAGCNGVEWDAVELPSQFMEKWAFDWDFLQAVGVHHKSGQVFSKQQFDSLIGIKNYHAGMFMVRQLEFGMFDFNLHMWVPSSKETEPNIQKILDEVRAKVTVVPVVPFNRSQNSFSHIFAGGYAAGYYSYNWAEVLASDAFMMFHDPKYVNVAKYKTELGTKFLNNILQQGGSREAMDLYIQFRGKRPSIDALLEYRGLK